MSPMSMGGRSKIWSQITQRDFAQQQRGFIVSPAQRTIFDSQIWMIGADDGAGNSPARYWSEYTNEWTEVSSPPSLFADGACVEWNSDPSHFYCGGGYNAATSADSVRWFLYDSDEDTYAELPACPVAHERCAVNVGGATRELIVGGADAPSDISLHAFAFGTPDFLADGTWTDIGPVPGGTGDSADFAKIRSMLFNSGGSQNTVEITRTGLHAVFGLFTRATLTGTLTDSIRLAHNFNISQGVGYYAVRVQGGVATTWVYNHDTFGNWNARAALPRPRENFGLVGRPEFGFVGFGGVHPRKMYVVGGGGTPWFDIYDPDTNTWTQGPDLDVGVSGVSIVHKIAILAVGPS